MALKDLARRLDYNAPVTLTFVLASGIVLLLGMATNDWTTQQLFCVYSFSPLDPLGYVRLFGHVLGHAGPQHYIGNMMIILLVGPAAEEMYGSKNLLEMIAITALVTGLAHIILFPHVGLLGASGVAFMLIVLSSVAGAKEGTIPLTLVVVAALFLGEQIITGVTSSDDISQLTHIIGGVLGGVFGLMLRSKGTQPQEL